MGKGIPSKQKAGEFILKWILISKISTRDREGHFIMTKVSIHKKDTITNILETNESPKICEAKFDKIKGEKDHSVTKDEYFSISLSIIDNTNRYDKKQTRKHIEYVNTIKQLECST